MDGHTVVVGRLPGVRRPGPSSIGRGTGEEPAAHPKRLRRLRKFGRVILNFVFLAMIACVLVMLGPALLGYHRYVILTGSMTGTYDRGSIVFDKPTPVSALKVGDPITYNPPPGFTSQTRVTHRIYSIHRGPDGTRIYKTKGDANQHPDAWKFTLNQATQDRVIFHIPEVGYLFVLLSLRDFRIGLVGFPTLIIGLVMMVKLWREGGAEARRQKLAAAGWQIIPYNDSVGVLQPIDAPATDVFPVRLDLGLRTVRGKLPDRRARKRVEKRSRLDLNLPLRVRRLTARAAGATLNGRSPHLDSLAPDASIATVRLLVTHQPVRGTS